VTPLLRRLAGQVARGFAAGSEIHESSAFRVHIWRNGEVFYRNRALAVRRPASWAPAIDEMAAIFTAADRVPRLEFFEQLWPDLVPALERAGWVCEMRAPLLALEAAAFAAGPARADIALIRPGDPRSLVRDFIRAAELVFEMPESPEDGSEIDLMLHGLGSGVTLCAASLDGGRPVSGASLIGVGAEAELAAVWTRFEARRQGRAEAVCRALLGHFFSHGGEVAWLSAGDGAAERLYRRLGFAPVGTQLNYAKLQA
jgi:ribosomal protein S18 acetylase RimI-like enzyme